MTTKTLKHTLTSSNFGERTTQEVSKCKIKRVGLRNIIIEENSYTFKNSKTTLIMNWNLCSNLKKRCCLHNPMHQLQHDIHSLHTSAEKKRVSLHRSNIKLTEHRKIYVLKHLSECSKENFKIMPIYQTDDYSLFQHTHIHVRAYTHTHREDIYIYTYTHIKIV